MKEKTAVSQDKTSSGLPVSSSTLVDISHNESRQDTILDDVGDHIQLQNTHQQDNDHSHKQNESKQDQESSTLTIKDNGEIYSVLSARYKTFIICTGAMISSFAQVTSFSHLPAVNSIREEFNTTVGMVNSIVGTCMAGFIVGSMTLGPLSDRWGRRPAMILVCAIYIGGCIGASRAPNIETLLAMRALQGTGISATLCISKCILLRTPSDNERGRYVAVYNTVRTTMPITFTVISGVISHTAGWRWIFAVFALFVFVSLLLFILFVPETLRTLVGNGSGHDTAPVLRCLKKTKSITATSTLRSRFCYMPNISASLRYLLYPDALCIQLLSSFMATNIAMMTASSTLFAEYYGLNDLQIGLTFIGREGGLLLGPLIMGPLLDRYYKGYLRKHGEKGAGNEEDARFEDNRIASDFPLFRARLSHNWWNVIINQATIAGFGWCFAKRVHISIPIILQGICAFNNYNVYSSAGILLIDLFPGRGASISACAGVTRSVLVLIYSETVGPGIENLGVGLCFTVFGLALSIGSCLIPVLIIFGPRWRLRRLQQEEKQNASLCSKNENKVKL
ncbi:major facilitator superfamily domain-containing protein [Syncephalastrum racemosum]|uniref:Major facilitator superfamily domain-containing protein n=1 Tax=Syncephalastrum racemosum TaxID=13706 RepID=A0A1X2HSX0_SYNRA|nr:major facilitator superfamily domain-containing protein [Syncephalastrum racemosum]